MWQRIADWWLEVKIDAALRAAMKTQRGSRDAAKAWARYSGLHDQRSAAQWGRMRKRWGRAVGRER